MRFALRKKEWDALKTQKDAEQPEKEKTGKAAAGSSFIQKLKIWREEKHRVAELSKEKVTEIEDLRRQERLHERELGASAAESSPQDKKQE